MDLLKVMLKLRCEEHDVAQKLVASTAHLEQIATSDEADVLALRGWRYAVFGRDAPPLTHGTGAHRAPARQVRVVPVGGVAEAGPTGTDPHPAPPSSAPRLTRGATAHPPPLDPRHRREA